MCLICCWLGFAKGKFPLRFPRKSPRPPCFVCPLSVLAFSGICEQVSVLTDLLAQLTEATYQKLAFEYAKVSLLRPSRKKSHFCR